MRNLNGTMDSMSNQTGAYDPAGSPLRTSMIFLDHLPCFPIVKRALKYPYRTPTPPLVAHSPTLWMHLQNQGRLRHSLWKWTVPIDSSGTMGVLTAAEDGCLKVILQLGSCMQESDSCTLLLLHFPQLDYDKHLVQWLEIIITIYVSRYFRSFTVHQTQA